MTEIIVKKVDVPGLETCTVGMDEWQELKLCPLCLSGISSTVISKVQDGPELSACRDCQFGYLSRRPTQEWIDYFYASGWDQKGQKVVPSIPINLRTYNICKDVLPKKAKVLEIGAGYGEMLIPFRDAGHLIGAVEPSGHRAENLVSQGVEVFKDIPTGGGWDLVVMHHCLEHLYDPNRTVRDISKALCTGGLLLILVPHFLQEHAIQASHYVPHLSLFTPFSLAKLVAQNGLYPVVDSGLQIQCVARKGGGGAGMLPSLGLGRDMERRLGAWDWKDEDFDSRTEKWALQGLASGETTVSWSIDENKVDRYPWLTMVGHLNARKLLSAKEDHLRSLWLDCPEKPELPITYIHENTNPVWFK